MAIFYNVCYNVSNNGINEWRIMSNWMRKKIIFGLILFLVAIYILFYCTMFYFGEIQNYHDLFLIGITILTVLSILTISLQEDNKFLTVACLAQLFVCGFYLFISFVLSDKVREFFDVIFHFFSALSLLLFLYGIFLELTRNLKRSQINLLAYEQNEAFYIEYYPKINRMIIEFSQKFVEKYQVEQTLFINPDIYRSYIHVDDLENVHCFDLNSKEKESKYRILFPGMKDYIFIRSKGAFPLENRYVCIGFDISEFELIQKNIQEKTKEYKLLELERRKIIESSEDLVAKFKTDGTIVYVSSGYSKLYSPDTTILGRNIFELNREHNRTDNEWFYETLKNHSFVGQGREYKEGKEIWVSWHNDVLLDEFGNVEYVISVGRDITDLYLLNESLEYQSLHDYTTGLLNNRGLYKAIKELGKINNAVCFFVDIYRFSSISDYYGHNTGNLVLKQVAEELKYFAQDHIVARHSGDQFVVLCANVSDNVIEDYLKRLTSSQSSLFEGTNNTSIPINLKIGYSQYPDDTNDINQLIIFSSLAMKEIYENHTVHVQKYEAYMNERFVSNISMSIKLKEAIKDEEIDIYFQKIINVKTNEVSYLEGLARWIDSTSGFISPEYFLNIAKQSGLIIQLEEYIFHKTIEKYAMLTKRTEYKNTKLTLNITPSSLLRNDVASLLETITRCNGLTPNNICIEISEKTFVENLEIYNNNIKELKKRGFLIALDDFGREYSSLSILDNIEFDIIKIDGAFVCNIAKPQNQAIVKMIMTISELSKKQIIAECVETINESKVLEEMNCFIQQGYYFHKPEKL